MRKSETEAVSLNVVPVTKHFASSALRADANGAQEGIKSVCKSSLSDCQFIPVKSDTKRNWEEESEDVLLKALGAHVLRHSKVFFVNVTFQ